MDGAGKARMNWRPFRLSRMVRFWHLADVTAHPFSDHYRYEGGQNMCLSVQRSIIHHNTTSWTA
jgi:hypothetical protein